MAEVKGGLDAEGGSEEGEERFRDGMWVGRIWGVAL